MRNWRAWAREDQIAPDDPDWAVWLVLGGRGSGKTRTGAEWVLDRVRRGAKRIALVAPTLHDAREVMLGGDSGLLRIGFRHERARYEPTRRRVVFPATSGRDPAIAYLFSAHDPDSLRGPQFDCAWGDEFCAWPDPEAVLSNLRLGLRLGAAPRLCLTSTPRPLPVLDGLLANAGTRLTRSRTYDNAANLAPGFIQAMADTYGGSALGRQEMDGEIVRDHPGAIFARADIDQARVTQTPPLDRILVALDPPATSGETADHCGLVVVGRRGEGREADAYVLRDASLPRAAPDIWAERAIALYHSYEADGILAESNQGGEMIETVIHQIDPDVPVIRRHATRSKRGRATPVGLLYARGRVHHVGTMEALEDELCAFGGPHQNGSPDRMDALVWGVSELLLNQTEPRLQFL
ncbi:DNA-packaging protein [Algimonas arctica]|nr:terminase family protein [Algimonas arctica]